MKLTCPGCGVFGSIEAFVSDAIARQCMRLILEMPVECGKQILPYLALFRPATGRGLAWDRAHRLVKELAGKIAAGHIQIERKPARPITPRMWGEALERIIAQPPQRLPLKTHGYLAAIAYDIADDIDRKAEVERNKLERSGLVSRDRGPAAGEDSEPVDAMEMIRKMREGIKKGSRIRGVEGSSEREGRQ